MTKCPPLFLAIASLVILSGAQSQPPPPSPTESAQEKQEAGNRKYSDTNPAQQSTVGPTEKNEYAKSQGGDRSNKSSTDWWIAAFTGALTFVGIIQLIAMFKQASYMRHGLAETKRAADAGKLSADAATKAADSILITDRAIVLIDTVSLNTETLNEFSTVLFTLKNFGQTIAYRVNFSGRFGGIGQEPIQETAANTIAPRVKSLGCRDLLTIGCNLREFVLVR
jgi:hypothetical protein